MSLFTRDALGRLVPVNPGLPADRGNQGGMGRRLSERDLMSRLPDADIAGAIGPGVVPGGEQSIGARRGKLEQADILPPAPTYRPLGGAQQNNRGNARAVTIPTFSGGPIQNIPSIVETSKNSGDDAEVITVQLALDLPAQFTTLGNLYALIPLEVTAIVEWGVGGAFFSAEVDWNLGVSFAICASFVRVSARVGAIPALIAQPDLDIVLKAALSYGNAMSVSQSSLTRKTVKLYDPAVTDQLAAGATSALFPIPSWALGLTMFATALNTQPDVTIELHDGTNAQAVYKFVDNTNQANQVEGTFPVPSQARFIRITNNTGLVMIRPAAIFNLGF